MTIPTLKGRWQMRLLVQGPVGLGVSMLFGLLLHDLSTLVVLFYIVLLGFGWDVLYQGLLHLRWDQDWPTLLQMVAGVLEGSATGGLIHILKWPGPSQLSHFVLFYSCLWLLAFMIGQGPLRIILPCGRYRGGEWL